MISQSRIRPLAVVAALLVLSIPTFPQRQAKQDRQKTQPTGTPVMWRDPGDIAARDLFAGPGGEGMKPDLRKITFLKQETGGYSTKFRVRDASDREWVAKIGREAQSEAAAVRLLWAIGYVTEINYLVPRLTIEGKGTFENVRLEARPEHIKRLDEWKWADNPFSGTRELRALIIMMAFLNNWDIKDANNKVLLVPNLKTGETRLHYIVSDLGATFGRVKVDAPVIWRIKRNRNDPADYAADPFLEDVTDGRVFLFYKGKSQRMFDDLRVEEAAWLGGLLAQLSDRQIGDAFRAANYTPGEVLLMTRAVRARIKELANIR
ncbi:MAG TPA: hypothetical protein VEY11_14105 [Pyrinomonadaceae bacterium]|nr:hypothetical protein [Pyrinomonadaceae bacterium]